LNFWGPSSLKPQHILDEANFKWAKKGNKKKKEKGENVGSFLRQGN